MALHSYCWHLWFHQLQLRLTFGWDYRIYWPIAMTALLLIQRRIKSSQITRRVFFNHLSNYSAYRYSLLVSIVWDTNYPLLTYHLGESTCDQIHEIFLYPTIPYFISWSAKSSSFLFQSYVSDIIPCSSPKTTENLWRVRDLCYSYQLTVSLPQLHGCLQKTGHHWVIYRGCYFCTTENSPSATGTVQKNSGGGCTCSVFTTAEESWT